MYGHSGMSPFWPRDHFTLLSLKALHAADTNFLINQNFTAAPPGVWLSTQYVHWKKYVPKNLAVFFKRHIVGLWVIRFISYVW